MFASSTAFPYVLFLRVPILLILDKYTNLLFDSISFLLINLELHELRIANIITQATYERKRTERSFTSAITIVYLLYL
jgi:hypothetical protein